MLGEALVRHGVKTAAFVIDTSEDEAAGRAAEAGGLVLLPPTRCDVPLSEAGKPRFPVDAWMASGAQGWLVSGPTPCARDVLRDVKRLLAGKPSAAGRSRDRGDARGGASRRPMCRAGSSSSARRPASFRSWRRVRRRRTTRTCARSSIASASARATGRRSVATPARSPAPRSRRFPPTRRATPKAVTQRRAIVQAGLQGAQLRFWTTDDKGIGADRVLPRALRLATWKAK